MIVEGRAARQAEAFLKPLIVRLIKKSGLPDLSIKYRIPMLT